MGSFEDARTVESQALADLLPHLRTDWQVIMTDGQEFVQKLIGDMIAKAKGGPEVKRIELKAEASNKYNNFFLESWSNRKWRTRGWMDTSQADWLWYYFVEQRQLYHMPFANLRAWAFGEPPHVLEYPEKPQSKYDQLNDTWGWCVDIDAVKAGVKGFRGPVDPSNIQQKEDPSDGEK